jgi:WD40 repeat protein
MKQPILRLMWLLFIFFITNQSPFTLAGSEKLHLIQLTNIQDFDLSPDGKRLVAADLDHTFKVLEIETNEILFHLEDVPADTRLNRILWSPDGKYISAAFGDGGRLWDADTGALLHTFTNHPVQPADKEASHNVIVVRVSPNGLLAATAGESDTAVIVYDLPSYNMRYQSEQLVAFGDFTTPRNLFFSPDSSLLAIQQFHGGPAVLDANTGVELYQLPGGNEAVSFSPDGTMIAAGGGRFTSHVWVSDTRTGKLLHEFESPLVLVDLQWSSDSMKLFGQFGEWYLRSGYQYTGEAVRVWDVNTGEEKHIFSSTKPAQLPVDLERGEIIIGVGEGESKDNVLIWNQENGEVYRKEYSTSGSLNTFEVIDKQIGSFFLSSETGIIIIGYEDELVVYNIDSNNLLEQIPIPSPVYNIKIAAATSTAIARLEDYTLISFHIRGNNKE